MITKVSLTNWRSHLNSELEFSEGTNCLIGRMGSGKSSVLDAICFGLFGTFPQLQQKKVRIEDMIMKKPKTQRFAEIRIEFDSNGDSYAAKRRIEKGKSTSAEFRKNGKLVETQSQKVTEEIEKALKVDYDLFTRAVYSEQNQLDMFLTIPKGQRMKKIDELLRLDRFEAARMSTVSLKNRFSLHREEKESMLEGMKENEIKAEADALQKEIETLENELKAFASQSETLAKRKDFLRKDIESLENMKERIREFNEKISLLENINKQLKSDTSMIEKQIIRSYSGSELDSLKQNTEALKNKIGFSYEKAKTARNEFLARKLELGAEKDRMNQLIKAMEEKKKSEKFLDENMPEKARIRMKEITEKIDGKTMEIGMLKTEIAGCVLAKDIKDNCMVCGHRLSEEKKMELVSESARKSEILAAKKSEAEKNMETLVSERKGVEKILREIELAEMRIRETGNPEAGVASSGQKIKPLTECSENLEKKIKDTEKETVMMQQELENLIREYETAKTAVAKKAELEKKQKMIEINLAETETLILRLNELKKSFSEAGFAELKEKMENLIGTEKILETKIQFASDMISEKRKRLESAEARKKMAEDCRNEIRKSEAMEQQLGLLERGLEVSQERLRKDFIGAINHAMHMIWENLYPYADFSSSRMAVDGDYVLQLQDANGWISVDNVSGGERSIACLALRIAFALVLAPQLRWLVLDEPTHNLDEKAVAELANVLHDNISEFVEQVFLITHDPALEPAVSGHLYRMEKEKDGFTKAIKIEEG